MRIKQRCFVLEYLVDLDPVAAAKRAGYVPRAGKRLITRPGVRAAIAAEMAARARRTGITAERLLAEYQRLVALDWAAADPIAVDLPACEPAPRSAAFALQPAAG